MSMKQRIRERLEALGKKARAASIEAGLNTHFLQRVLAEENAAITTENLIKIAKVLETTPEWLLTGKAFEDIPPGAEELLSVYRELDEQGRRGLVDVARWKLRDQKEDKN